MANARYIDFDPSTLQPAGEPTRSSGVSGGDGYQGMDIVSTPMMGPNGERFVHLTVNGQDAGFAQPNDAGGWTAFRNQGGQWVASDERRDGFWKDITGDKRLMAFLAVAGAGAAAGAAGMGSGVAGISGGTGATAGTAGAGLSATGAGVGAAAGGGTLGALTGGGTAAMSAGELAAMDAAGGAMAGTGLPAAAGGAAGGSTLSSLLSGAGNALSTPAGMNTLAQLLAGAYGANAANRAAEAQERSVLAGIAEQRRQYDQTREDLQPWMTAGRDTLGQLTGRLPELTAKFDPSQLANDPGYQFELEQGLGAVRGGARGNGTLDSGATLKELMKYGQGLASTRVNEAFNRDQAQKSNIYNMLAGISGTGQSTASQVGAFGANTGNNVSSLLTQGGNARAAGIVGGANAWTGAAGNIYNGWQQQNTLDRLTRGSNLYGG